MGFDVTTWKQSATDRLRGLGDWLKRQRDDAPYAAYGALCGLSLWPLVETARTGDTLGVMLALGSVAGGRRRQPDRQPDAGLERPRRCRRAD